MDGKPPFPRPMRPGLITDSSRSRLLACEFFYLVTSLHGYCIRLAFRDILHFSYTPVATTTLIYITAHGASSSGVSIDRKRKRGHSLHFFMPQNHLLFERRCAIRPLEIGFGGLFLSLLHQYFFVDLELGISDMGSKDTRLYIDFDGDQNGESMRIKWRESG